MKTKIVITGLTLLLLSIHVTLSAQINASDGKNKVQINGKNIKVISGNSTSGNITISGVGKQKESYDGNGKTVTISGTHYNIYISGVPAHISISGSNNTIHTEGAISISTAGSNNQVYYAKLVNNTKPSIATSGSGNTVTKEN